MPYKLLKEFISVGLTENENSDQYNFKNTFSEILNRETTHEEAVVLLIVLVPHILPDFFDDII